MSERLSPEQRAAAVLLLEEQDPAEKINVLWLCMRYNLAYGRAIDWHEFIPLLDDLVREGKLRIVQATGFTAYAFPEPKQAPEIIPQAFGPWHARRLYGNQGGDQGVVIDDQTGDNVAVTYRAEDAALVAAAPALLKALRATLERVEHQEHTDDPIIRQAYAALDQATDPVI